MSNNAIRLIEAIRRHGKRMDARSYESYRAEAHARGAVSIRGRVVPAFKRGGRWMVDVADFDAAVAAALESEAREKRLREQAATDYDAHRLHHAGPVATTWGGYRVSGAFHFVWSADEIMRRRSDGQWRCNGCWKLASTENGKPECHRCTDWGPCGADCTLSRVYCEECGTSLEL